MGRGHVSPDEEARKDDCSCQSRKVAGVFQWTLLGETDLQSQPRRYEVPLPNPDKLGIDMVICFWERTWGARIPWNEGLRDQTERGCMAANYPLDPNYPVKGEG